jgi:hypothetical protein
MESTSLKFSWTLTRVVGLNSIPRSWERIEIHASTTQNAIACLEFLVGLPDSCFTHMQFGQYNHDNPLSQTCLLTPHLLEKILNNSKRSTGFRRMIFTVEQSRVLATCGLISELALRYCSCDDDGARFVPSYGEGNGPRKLRFAWRLPFNREHWASFLNQHNPPEHIELIGLSLDLEDSRAVAAARLQSFILNECNFHEDKGKSLIESIRTGRGPQGLSFGDTTPFTTLERWMSFMKALEENNGSLHFLKIRAGTEIRTGRFSDEILQALADALPKNNGLVELSICFESVVQWNYVLQAISTHPTLRKLDLSFFGEVDPVDASHKESKRLQTQDVADMLSVNKQVEDIQFHDNAYDRSTWDTDVAPRLEYNIYRKRFPAIQRVGDTSTRAAILGAAMDRVRTRPSLLYMLLCDNHDTVVSHLPSSTPSDNNATI